MIDQLDLPTALDTATRAGSGDLRIRRATLDDLDALIALLADDTISAQRGDLARESDRPAYERALRAILDSTSNELVVVVGADDRPIGTTQLTLIPGMSRQGASRVLVEAVRVASSSRSLGIGGALMRWVMEIAAPALGASMVQLTSDAARGDAHRFYLRLGFTDSHVGFKYSVPQRVT